MDDRPEATRVYRDDTQTPSEGTDAAGLGPASEELHAMPPETDDDPKQTGEPPTAQLRLVHEELNRQRELTHKRHDAMRTRAIFLAGAATAALGAQAPKIQSAVKETYGVLRHLPGLPEYRELVHVSLPAVFTVLAILAALVSGWCGLRCLRVERGGEINATLLARNALTEGVSEYAVEWALVGDKLAVHDQDNERLEGLRRWFHFGGILLAVSWLLVIGQFSISS